MPKRDRNTAWGTDCVQQMFTALELIAQHIPFIFETYAFTGWRTKTKHYAIRRGTFLDIYWQQSSGFMLTKPHRAMWWVAVNTAYKALYHEDRAGLAFTFAPKRIYISFQSHVTGF